MSTEIDFFDRLLEVALLLQQDMDSSLGALGLTPARAHLLWVLHKTGPCTQKELADALDVSPRNVTGLVDALEPSGLLQRRPHPTDRRAILVTLTEPGAKAMARMARERAQAATQLVAGLDADQLTQFRDTLDSVVTRLRDLVAAAGSGTEGAI